MSSLSLRFVASRIAAAFAAFALAALALPAAAKTMIYLSEGYGSISCGAGCSPSSTWYAALNSAEGKARLVGNYGARSGTYTDNGTEILVTLSKPLSIVLTSSLVDCPPQTQVQYQYRHDIEQVLFRRVGGTNVNNGKSQVVEIGRDTILDTCNVGEVTPFGSLSDPGTAMIHRSTSKREPMTDVIAGLTIAGLREPAETDVRGAEAADIVTLETATTVHFQRSGHVFDAALSSDQWLVLQMPGFQRAFTRVVVDASKGIETWLQAAWKDGKPQTVFQAEMTKPLPGANFGTKAATSRMWESMVALGTNNPFFIYLYRDFTGDRVQKDLIAATEDRIPITWRFEGIDVILTRIVGTALSERRWTPLGRTGKYMSIMEQEWRTPSGGSPYLYVAPRVIFYVDRGAAYPPAP